MQLDRKIQCHKSLTLALGVLFYSHWIGKETDMSTAQQELKSIEERCARQVCGCGYITKSEADLLWKLRAEVGMKYDAVNCRWEQLDQE